MAKDSTLKRPVARSDTINGNKDIKLVILEETSRPTKRAKLLDDSSESEDEVDSAPEPNIVLKVNEDYAKRFEHNKKREEKQRCRFKPLTLLTLT